jgi:uncharacterized protein (TIGR03083 family)
VAFPDANLNARCDELGELWHAWAAALERMPPAAWKAPTRLEGWDVAALVGHHSLFPGAVQKLATRGVDGPPAVESAAALLRRFNQPEGAAGRLAGAVAEQARNVATSTSQETMVRRFRDDGPVAIATARAAGPIAIDYFGNGTLALDEALTIAVLEATTHLLDLQRALGGAPDVPSAGLSTSVMLLARVADPVAFIEAATGRTAESPLPVIR